jgi:3-hydroxyisobutyrate dehydrogenase-like beta-hydroxyacid dehydrogenase
MTTSSRTVGFVGLGIIGTALSSNLIEDGVAVVGFDLRQTQLDAFAAAGGTPAGSPRDVANRSDVVLTAVATLGALVGLVSGPDGLAATENRDVVVADLGTLPVEEKQRARDILAEAGIPMLDCTISGTGAQAVVRDLTFMASGDPAAVAVVSSVLAPLGRAVFDLGEFGNALRMKLIANHLVGIHSLAAAEAMLIAERAGLDQHQVLEVIGASAGTSRMFEVRGPLIADRTYDVAQARVDMWVKDLILITDFAQSVGAATPLLDATMEVFQAANASSLGLHDAAAVFEVLAARSGQTEDD